MAPSVQQLPEETPVVASEKIVPIVAKPAEETPKVKRQIDLEGGKTDAKVNSFPLSRVNIDVCSTHNTSLRGITDKSILLWSFSTTLNTAKTQTPLSKTSFLKAARFRNSLQALDPRSLVSN